MYFINVRYPEREEELEVVNRTTGGKKATVNPILSGEELVTIQKQVREVPISRHLVEYALDIVRATRMDRGLEGDLAPDFVRQYVEWGAGPRAAQYMVLGAKSLALLEGRSHVSAADLRKVAYPVLSHRIIVNFAAQAERITSKQIIDQILKHVPVPETRTAVHA